MTFKELAIKNALEVYDDFFTDEELEEAFDTGFLWFIPDVTNAEELGRAVIDKIGGFPALPIEEFEGYRTTMGEFDFATWAQECIIDEPDTGGEFTTDGYIAMF